MRYRQVQEPSGRLATLYGSPDAAAARRMDAAFIDTDRHVFTAAVVDGAPNIGDRTRYHSPAVAIWRGLREGELLNGGVIAAGLFDRFIRSHRALNGPELVAGLNAELRTEYARLAMWADPAHRELLFTGYAGVARVQATLVTITAVGCNVAVNGRIVAGGEKWVDRLNFGLVEAAAAHRGIELQAAYELLMPALNRKQFELQNAADMTYDERVAYMRFVLEAVRVKLRLDTDGARELMRLVLGRLPAQGYWYPAIDGTATPDEGIFTATYPRSQVNTVVLWTGGFALGPRSHRVLSLSDLAPVRPEFSERAAVALAEVKRPEIRQS